MKIVKNIIKRIIASIYSLLEKMVPHLRNMRYKLLRIRLKNKNPSIISSDCIGGVTAHNLGLRFNSPTVNLYFEKEDFFTFVENLPEFLNAEITEIKDKKVNCPVGRIEYNNKKVDVFFMHYKTFGDAKRKWDERKKRVDFSNIYIIQNTTNPTEQDVKRFEALPYNNKMMISKDNPTNSSYVVTHSVFKHKDYSSGQILGFKSPYSLKRYIDDIDFIGFLNVNKD